MSSTPLRKLIITCAFLFNVTYTDAQVLNDTASLKLVKEAVDQIYSMKFGVATETCNRIDLKYPGHPVVFLLRGMTVYWQGYPLLYGSDESKNFEKLMLQCIEKCDDPEPQNEAEFLLANMCARGILLAYYVSNELHSKVFTLARTTYKYLRRSFEYTTAFPDFLFFTGLYNYYREAYSQAHPVYRPFIALFPRGDREKGMYELRTAFKKSIFLRAEASTFLSSNYKYFENDYINASYFSRTIYDQYPANIVYRLNCIEDLLLNKKYNDAENLIKTDTGTNNDYFNAQLIILRGILIEKKYSEIKDAEQKYSSGAEKILEFSSYGKQYAAYAYFGLSRISTDIRDQKFYRRKALDLTDFSNVTFDE
ncbi:MAG TPA: hypothetical protein VHO46_15020 [Bacteroidales bacterium]|nr:hypothetical protein [Bacteroidales bacterium]